MIRDGEVVDLLSDVGGFTLIIENFMIIASVIVYQMNVLIYQK